MMLSTSSASARMLARRTPCAGRMACGSLAGGRPTAAVGRRGTVAVVAAFASTNPALTMGRVQDAIYETGRGGRGEIMTVEGTLQKTGLLMAVAMVGAAYTWMQFFSGTAAASYAALGASKIAGMVGFASAIATMFKPNWAPVTGLIYALANGVAVGGMGAMMELRYPGIVLNATMLTLGTAFSLFAAFQARIIDVTDSFRSAVTMVTGGYMITMLGTWVLGLCGLHIPGLFSAGPLGIGVGLVSAGLAASNLLIDFDMIRSTARQRMPKWFEYYSAFSLMVTLVWMWTSVLRLLSLLSGRDD